MKISKIVDSRDNWKGKAKSRGSTVRTLRKTYKAHKMQHACDKAQITRLESEITQLRTQLREHGVSLRAKSPTICGFKITHPLRRKSLL